MGSQYLFSFRPVDSFTFSGEMSMQTKKRNAKAVDDYLSNDQYADRRQSFLVKTENMPPQTSIMGAIRYWLLRQEGIVKENGQSTCVEQKVWDELIGAQSFNPANPCGPMGIIEGISPVCIKGNIANAPVLCVPAPADNLYETADQGQYQPMHVGDYDPKESDRTGFFLYPLAKKDDKLQIETDCAEQWKSQSAFFATQLRPAFHVPEDGSPREGDGDYHMQERCFLKDLNLACKDGSACLCDPAFGVIVTLKREPKGALAARFVNLGGRGSQFRVTAERCSIELEKLKPPACIRQDAKNDYRLSLLSPAQLPEDWRSTAGLKMAFLSTRALRCSVSEIMDPAKLKLIPERLRFAQTGSVFVFESAEQRENFRKKLNQSSLRICGFNQTMCYETTEEIEGRLDK